MILLISQDHSEFTTDKVIDWISFKNHEFKRVNGNDVYRSFNVSLNKNEIKFNIYDIDWEKINCVWFRRWISIYNKDEIFLKSNYKTKDKKNLVANLNKYIREEYRAITKYFFNSIPDNISFNKIFDEEINKLVVLRKAIEYGLNIPDTIISTNFKKLNLPYEYIVKPISNTSNIHFKNDTYIGYTSILNKELPYSDKEHAPSLIQKKVDKKYEIRVFYMEDLFYSMAIFSQNDTQTEIDFRNYNKNRPNRFVPYNLPKTLEKKLKKIVKFFNLNTCSFDLILSKTNKYYFLEVNPGGQFGMVSYPCNYFLEEKLATLLIKTDKENYEK